MDIGHHLKKFRKKKGLSQQELADELNLSRTAVSKIENGVQKVEIETFKDWAIVTNCEIQAAVVLFGADIFNTAAQLVQLVPAFSNFVTVSQIIM